MVDNISKPFTFIANTYAKASEVNADFDALYSGTNACINQVNDNITDISNLDSNKANKNGSTQEVFKVKDPENNSDAVNKQSMMKAMGNSIDIISGFIITKDQTSPNDTIVVSPGNCYDSTHSVILSSNTSITKQNENQGASTTYYVYATSVNASGSPMDITISSSAVSPGTTRYRLIGSFTTNSSGNIDIIEMLSSSIESIKNSIGNASMVPDWGNAYTFTIDSSHTAASNGFIFNYNSVSNISGIFTSFDMTVGSNRIIRRQYCSGSALQDGGIMPISKGDSYIVRKPGATGVVLSGTFTCLFIPAKVG